ncbi:hypothetical protein Bbelb_248540 [Branchiostoma belcheri]|nr:hypothetical protein Bbelb_248540 [Branchiostoma belcheri]
MSHLGSLLCQINAPITARRLSDTVSHESRRRNEVFDLVQGPVEDSVSYSPEVCMRYKLRRDTDTFIYIDPRCLDGNFLNGVQEIEMTYRRTYSRFLAESRHVVL